MESNHSVSFGLSHLQVINFSLFSLFNEVDFKTYFGTCNLYNVHLDQVLYVCTQQDIGVFPKWSRTFIEFSEEFSGRILASYTRDGRFKPFTVMTNILVIELSETFRKQVAARGGVYPSMHWAGCVYPSMHWARGCVSQHALGRGVCIPACTGQGGVCPGVSAWGCLPGGGYLPGGCMHWRRVCL